MTHSSAVAGCAILLGLAWLLGACRELPLNPVADESAASTAASAVQQAPTSEIVFGPAVFVRETGKPNSWNVPFTVADFEVYQQGAVLVVRNGRANGSRRVSSATISLNGNGIVGPQAFSQRVSEIRVPITLPATGNLAVQIESGPGSEIAVWIEARFTAGISRLGPAGGSLQSDDGLATVVLNPGLSNPVLVSLQRVESDAPNIAAPRLTEGYAFRMWSGDQGANAQIIATTTALPDPFWTDQVEAEVQFQLNASVTTGGVLTLGTVAGSTAPVVAEGRLVNAARAATRFLAVTNGPTVTLWAWQGPTGCDDVYDLVQPDNVENGTKTPVIFVHGIQAHLPDCPAWYHIGFEPRDQGKTLEAILVNRGLGTNVAFHRYIYPTFASVATAASKLANKIQAVVGTGPKALLVGHSMGGLVARDAVELYGANAYVSTVITLGTPHLGTPMADPTYTSAGLVKFGVKRRAVILLCLQLPSTCADIFGLATITLYALQTTNGMKDLLPTKQRSYTRLRQDIRYHLFAGTWSQTDGCGNYGLCEFINLAHSIMQLNDGGGENDGFVFKPSALLNEAVANIVEAPYGQGYHHLALHQGKQEGDLDDPLLDRVANIIRAAITPPVTTAIINVTSNVTTSWEIQPGSITGSGTSASHTVTPSPFGTAYTITPAPQAGYTPTVANSDGGATDLVLSPGQTKSFAITYMPTGVAGILYWSTQIGSTIDVRQSNPTPNAAQLGSFTIHSPVVLGPASRFVAHASQEGVFCAGAEHVFVTLRRNTGFPEETVTEIQWGGFSIPGPNIQLLDVPILIANGETSYTLQPGTYSIFVHSQCNTGSEGRIQFVSNAGGTAYYGYLSANGETMPLDIAAIVNVAANRNTTWSVGPDAGNGSGISASHSVAADPLGSVYMLSPAQLSGFTVAVSNSDGGGSGLVVQSGQVKSFGLTYTPFMAADPFLSQSIAVGLAHTCALTTDGAAWCWGANPRGELGDGSPIKWVAPYDVDDRDTPVRVIGGLTFVELVAGDTFTCGLTSAGRTYCWGMFPGWQQEVAGPVEVAIGFQFVSISANGPNKGGRHHVCGLTASGNAYCWGSNENGQLGTGDFGEVNEVVAGPVEVVGGHTWRSIAVGMTHTCGITLEDVAYCWGSNSHGQLGDGSAARQSVPVAVAGGLTFQSLTAGGEHTCGVTIVGKAYCWGTNGIVIAEKTGQLGDGTFLDRAVPSAVAGDLVFSSLTAGRDHTCGVTITKAGFCWGHNHGALGIDLNPSFVGVPVPALIAGSHIFSAIQASYRHTCGLTISGGAYCWGANFNGRLGDGIRVERSIPVPVFRP